MSKSTLITSTNCSLIFNKAGEIKYRCSWFEKKANINIGDNYFDFFTSFTGIDSQSQKTKEIEVNKPLQIKCKEGKCILDGVYLALSNELMFLGEIKIASTKKEILVKANSEIEQNWYMHDVIMSPNILSVSKFPSENPNPVFRISYEGIVIYANQACIKHLSGLNNNNNNNNNKRIVLEKQILDIHLQIIKNNKSAEFELLIDNNYFLFNSAIIEGEKYVNYYGTDITEKKIFASDAELSFKRMSSLLENLNGAVIAENEVSEIILSNDKVEKILGITIEPNAQTGLLEINNQVLSTKVFAELFHEPKTRKVFSSEEIILKSGRIYRREFIPVYLNDTYRGCLWKFNDITKQKQEELALEKAKCTAEKALKFKSNFLSNMSHEIRTPLTGIIGMAHLLLKTKIQDSHKKYAEHIVSCSNNLLTIINDILDLSKIESEKLLLEKIPFDLEKIYQGAIANVSHLLIDKVVDLKFEMNLTIGSSMLIGDPVRLNQIITNLLSNAIKFTDDGSVTIVLETKEVSTDEIMLITRVIDTGIGIAESKLDSIFNSFEQAESGTTRKYGGTGLGLPICKMLVHLHGGTIKAESELGKGSIFSLKIPYLKVQNKIEKKQITRESEANLKNLNILVVDDNLVNNLYTKEILTAASSNVTTASNGLEAIELAAANSYDIIFMDIQMPEMDGIKATKHIRSVLNIQTPIIAFTANTMEGQKENYLRTGMTDFLSKPYYSDDLFSVIRKCLNI